MCGRYALAFVRGFATRFELMDASAARGLVPRFNIAPTQMAPIVISGSGNELVMMRWGLIPFWSKDMRIGNRLINARAEGLAKRPAFRASLKRRRCIVPATGFYEWRRDGTVKTPYHLQMKDGDLFGMAGLYDRWRSPDQQDILSFTIVTTEPNDLAGRIHNRMPVILRREDEHLWAAPGPIDDPDLGRILRPFPASRMKAFRVSKEVNSPKADNPRLLEPEPPA